MPRFDNRCLACGHEAEIWAKPFEHPPCEVCGGATERVWKTATRIIGDEIQGGIWLENLGPNPMQFFSKSEIAREAKRRGLEPMVRHVPIPGSDKSPHTTSWDVPCQYTLDAAKALVERVTSVQVKEPESECVGPVATPALVKETWQTLSRTPR